MIPLLIASNLDPEFLKLELLHVFVDFIHISIIGFNELVVVTVTVGAVFNVP